MGAGDYAAVVVVWVLAITAPGPDVVLVLRQTVRGGRPAGVAAAAGIALGIVAWIVLAMVGAHLLLDADDRILGTLQVLGGAYLVVLGALGLQAALASPDPHESALAHLDATPADAGSDRHLVRRSFGLGLLTNLSNPKALVFFGSVFTVLIPETATTAERVVLSVLLVALSVAWFGGLALAASAGRVGAFLARNAARLDTIAAVAFVVLGLVSVATGVAAFV